MTKDEVIAEHARRMEEFARQSAQNISLATPTGAPPSNYEWIDKYFPDYQPHLYAPGELEELQNKLEAEAASRPKVLPIHPPIDWDTLTAEEKIEVAGGDITGSDEELARQMAAYDAAEAEIEAAFENPPTNPPQNTDG